MCLPTCQVFSVVVPSGTLFGCKLTKNVKFTSTHTYVQPPLHTQNMYTHKIHTRTHAHTNTHTHTHTDYCTKYTHRVLLYEYKYSTHTELHTCSDKHTCLLIHSGLLLCNYSCQLVYFKPIPLVHYGSPLSSPLPPSPHGS